MQRYNTFARVFSHKVSHIDVLAVIVWSTQWGQTQFGSLILYVTYFRYLIMQSGPKELHISGSLVVGGMNVFYFFKNYLEKIF